VLRRIPPSQSLLPFEAVARLRHSGRAADKLCINASAISHRIRQLEAHVGFKLFGRNDFNLTADGAAYLANVRAGLAAFQQMPSRRPAKSSARLRVAVTRSLAGSRCRPPGALAPPAASARSCAWGASSRGGRLGLRPPRSSYGDAINGIEKRCC